MAGAGSSSRTIGIGLPQCRHTNVGGTPACSGCATAPSQWALALPASGASSCRTVARLLRRPALASNP